MAHTTLDPNYRSNGVPVYQSLAALGAYIGPGDQPRYAIVDGVGLFRWYLNDTTAANDSDVVEPTGGSVGRWKLSVPFGGQPRSKPAVTVVATANLTLSGLQTIDSIALAAGDVVLASGQTTASERAPWVVASGAWTRPVWFDSTAEAVLGSEVYVLRGTLHGGSYWVMTTPTTGTVTLGTTSLAWQKVLSPLFLSAALPLAPGAALAGASGAASDAGHVHPTADAGLGGTAFFPTGVAATDTVALETALNAGQDVVLYGTVSLTRPIVVIVGGGALVSSPELPATIRPHSSWSGAGVASPDNAFIRLVETEAAQAATTPSAAQTPANSPTLALVSATGFTAGRYFKTLGTSFGNDQVSQSAGELCPTEELLQVDSVSVNTVTHRLPQSTWIGQNNGQAPFKQLKLLDAAVDGFRIEGVRFDAYVDGAQPIVACGIQGSFARALTLRACSFKGFTYSAIYARGCRDWQGIDLSFLGANNQRFYLFSCQNFSRWECHDRLEVRERTNSRGSAYPTYAWVWRSQCTDLNISGSIDCAVGGIQGWGGANIRLDAEVHDLDFTLLGGIAGPADDLGGRRGYVLDTCANALPQTEVGRGNHYRLRWTACHSGSAKYWPFDTDQLTRWHAAIYVHDQIDFLLQCKNNDLGTDPKTSTQYRWLGITCQDVFGRIEAELRGFTKGIVFEGVVNDISGTLAFNSYAGAGSLDGSEAALCIDGCPQALPRFERLILDNTWNALEFYENFSFPLTGYTRPIVEHLKIPHLNGTTFESEARNVTIARMPNSSTMPLAGIAYPIDDAAASNGERWISASTAAAPAAGTFITLMNIVLVGVTSGSLRIIPGVVGGPAAVCPIAVAPSTTLGTRAWVEVDVNGRAVIATNGADPLATLTRIVGRNSVKCILGGGGGYTQLRG